MDLDDAKTGGGRDKAPMPSDLIKLFRFPEKKWVTVRLLPGLMTTGGYWIRTKKKAGGFTKFPTPCPSFDPESQERDSTKYDPWRDLEASERAKNGDKKLERDEVLVQFSRDFFMNAIIRVEQKKEPSTKVKHTATERKTGFKDKDSDSWTPVAGIKLGTSFMGKVKELKGLNTVESSKTGAVKAFAVNDPKFGRDIRVYYDPTKSPADQYNIQLGDKRTPLTEEELEYLTYDLQGLLKPAEVNETELKRDFESWATRNGVKLGKAKAKASEEDDEDEDDEDEAPKSKKKPAKKIADDFDDEDEDDEDDEDDEPKAKKKPAAKSKSKPVEDDEEDDEPPAKSKKKPTAKKKADDDFDDEDEDEDDDEDEDEPPAKKSVKKPVKGKAKPVDADEDDFDEDEDEDDEPAPKSKKKPAAKAKAKDDDFDDEDEDDEDDEPAPKKKPAAKAKPASKKKPVDDDEDDFDEDDDEDEDEDEPPAKSKKKPAAKPAASKKKKPADDEDDDEDF